MSACVVLLLVVFLVPGLGPGCASPPEADERFVEGQYVSTSGGSLPYRLFVPGVNDPDWRYPVVIFLHGGQGAGTDNLAQISRANWSGSHVWIQPQHQAKHPAFVIAPQLPGLHRWDYPSSDELSTYGQLVIEFLGELRRTHSIDTTRVYVTGQSRGGAGVWDLISKRPDLFAAAIPVCGRGDTTAVSSMRDVPVWAFHGARDHEVKVERSREMVRALQAVGADVRYTEYRFSAHAIWDRAYSETELVDWLFSHRKQR